MLSPPTPPTKGKEMELDGSDVGELLINLAENGFQDRTSTPTEKYGGTIQRAPTR